MHRQEVDRLTMDALRHAYDSGIFGYEEPVIMKMSELTAAFISSHLLMTPDQYKDYTVQRFRNADIIESGLLPDGVIEFWLDEGEWNIPFPYQPVVQLTIKELQHA